MEFEILKQVEIVQLNQKLTLAVENFDFFSEEEIDNLVSQAQFVIQDVYQTSFGSNVKSLF
jgi:hypothetical protein